MLCSLLFRFISLIDCKKKTLCQSSVRQRDAELSILKTPKRYAYIEICAVRGAFFYIGVTVIVVAVAADVVDLVFAAHASCGLASATSSNRARDSAHKQVSYRMRERDYPQQRPPPPPPFPHQRAHSA